jgi:hypothetical protein
MKKIVFLVFLCILIGFHSVHAQQSVGIGTNTPNPRAVLQLVSPGQNQGFLLPKLTTTQITTLGGTLGPGDIGLQVYDSLLQQIRYWNGTAWLTVSTATSLGTVTSVGLSLPSIFTVSGSPVTTSGTLTGTLVAQGQNTFFAGPTTGTATPTFRALVAGDIPSLPASIITSGTLPVARGGTNGTATPTAGAVAYGTGTAYAFTSAGTTGQLLQSNGAGAPTWVNPPGEGWLLSGNAGTNPATNFIGTTDPQALRVRTNNIVRMNILESGEVGIGVGVPVQQLDVLGRIASRRTDSSTFGVEGGSYRIQEASYVNTQLGSSGYWNLSTGAFGNPIANYFFIENLRAGTIGFRVYQSGNVGIGPIGFSDIVNESLGIEGNLSISNTSNNFKTVFNPAVQSSDINYTLPSAQGSANQVLTNNGSGVLSWQLPSVSSWGITGNAGTLDGTNFIGTSDNVPFTIRTNDIRSARLEPAPSGNSFFGFEAGLNVPNASTSTAMGYQALRAAAVGSQNTAIGYRAMNATNNAIQNVAVGMNAMEWNTTGSQNTAIGYGVLGANTDGLRNVAVGMSALNANTLGDDNVSVGYQSLSTNITGDFNVAIGSQALQNTRANSNVAVGIGAGALNTTGTSNTFLGSSANASVNNLTNATAVGANATVSQSNTLILGNNVNVGIGASSAGLLAGSNRYLTLAATTSGFTNLTASLELVGNAAATNTLASKVDFLGVQPVSNATIERARIEARTGNGATGAGQLLFYTNSGSSATSIFERMRIRENGSIGIGTTGLPTALVSVGTNNEFQISNTGNLQRINNVAYNWPNANSSGVLLNDGAGNLSWGAGFVSGSGAATRLAFWDGTNSLTSNADLFWDNTNFRLGIGTDLPFNALSVVRSIPPSAGLNEGVFLDLHNSTGAANYMAGIRFKVNGDPVNVRHNAGIFYRLNPSVVGELNFAIKSNATTANISAGDIQMTLAETGNLGIGTTVPTAQLHTTGSVRFQGLPGGVLTTDAAGNVSVVSGTAVVGSGTINRLTYWNTGSTIAAGSNLGWDNANERLGIGIGIPDVSLHVSIGAPVDVFSKYTNTNTFIGAGNGFTVGILSGGDGMIRHLNPFNLRFATDSIERMRITGTGNVGIGTTSPFNLLGISGAIPPTAGNNEGVFLDMQNTLGAANHMAGIRFKVNSFTTNERFNAGIFYRLNPFVLGELNFAIKSNASTANISASDIRMTLAETGNVGIGTTNPSSRLHIAGNTSITNRSAGTLLDVNTSNLDVNAYLRFSQDGPTLQNPVFVGVDFDNGISEFWNQDALAMRFGTNNLERMRVSAAGNVGVGTTAPLSALHIAREAMTSSEIAYFEGHSNITTRGPGITFRKSTGTILAPAVVGIGDYLGGFTANGRTSTAYNISSSLNFEVDAPVVGTSVPGRIIFSTTAALASSPTERLRINSIGNVGIGTTAPDSRLHVAENVADLTGVDGAFLDIQNSFNSASNGYMSGIRFRTDGVGAGADARFKGGIFFRKTGSFGVGDMIFATRNTADNASATAADASMTILSTGEVGIGTTTPARLLDVQGINFQAIRVASTNNTGAAFEMVRPGAGNNDFRLVNTANLRIQYGGNTDDLFSGAVDLMTISTLGNVVITGSLSKASGTFKIDHPSDPANKYLVHSFVESPDMMNIYNGNVVTNSLGEAIITLPEYFGILNKDFRYQLTPIGVFSQAIVLEEISEITNAFKIKTDQPNVKVSWQVTGVRKDPYANANRIKDVVEKSPEEKGYYLHPQLYGQPIDRHIGRAPVQQESDR